MFKKLSVVLTFAASFSSTVAISATPEQQAAFQPLSNSRQYIQLPSYSDEQKQLIADQAKKLLSIYVNRENKTLLYGNQLDVVPRINAIQQNAVNLSDEELHNGIQTIFKSQRDLHLNYSYPTPYSCFLATQVFSLTEIYSPTTSRKAVISSFLDFLIPLAPEVAQLSIGDELVSINGRSLTDVVNSLVDEGAGANNFGSFNRALEKISFRSFRVDRLPNENSATYQFKRASDGSLITVNVPWITVGDADCIRSSETLLNRPMASNGYKEEFLTPFGLSSDKSEDLYQQEFNKLYGRTTSQMLQNAGVVLNDTVDTTIQWAIINNRYGSFGYLSLASMVPSTGPIGGVKVISELLSNQLADTDGLIVDVRNNGGGFVIYAEILPQLFTGNTIEPYGSRALKSDINEFIFVDLQAEGAEWRDAYLNILDTDKKYTQPIKLTTPYLANDLVGQLYFKPVAMLTNAACYSACDLIAGLMQDFTDTTLWGEDLLTGAGGANVIGFNDALIGAFELDQFPQTGIKPLPGGQDMRVAWRQSIRTGESDNRILEDLGVRVDRRARPTVSDLQGKTQSQFDRIGSDLKYRSWDKQSKIEFLAPQQFNDFAFINLTGTIYFGYELIADPTQPNSIDIKVTKTDRVNVSLNGVQISSVYTYGGGSSGKEVSIQLPDNLPAGNNYLLQLEGVTYGDIVWRANRLIRK
ncbi:MAG: hypothetical protein HWE27_16005 [Gammaproteobacteria bacterium]|nr:hypothetical protein [Gammaproteobacteria bacterium]